MARSIPSDADPTAGPGEDDGQNGEQGHNVYVAFGSEVGLPRKIVGLPRPWRYGSERELGRYRIGTAKGTQVRVAFGRSLPVLRGLMSASPSKRPQVGRFAA